MDERDREPFPLLGATILVIWLQDHLRVVMGCLGVVLIPAAFMLLLYLVSLSEVTSVLFGLGVYAAIAYALYQVYRAIRHGGGRSQRR